jgi:hypothetical protein
MITPLCVETSTPRHPHSRLWRRVHGTLQRGRRGFSSFDFYRLGFSFRTLPNTAASWIYQLRYETWSMKRLWCLAESPSTSSARRKNAISRYWVYSRSASKFTPRPSRCILERTYFVFLTIWGKLQPFHIDLNERFPEMYGDCDSMFSSAGFKLIRIISFRFCTSQVSPLDPIERWYCYEQDHGVG